jgi:sugar lactone lactonase YvrE
MKNSRFFAFVCLLSLLFTSAVQGQTAPAGTWSSAGSLTSLRSQAAATTLRDGRVLITGGVSSGTWLSSAEIYDGNSFTVAPRMTVARSNHAAATLSNGNVVIAGGYTGSGIETNSIEIYNPTSNRWSAGPGMVQARAGHTMTVLNDGRLLIAGGMGNAGPLASLEIYDPTSNSCTAVSVSMSSPRIDHAAAILTSGAVLMAGGFDGSTVLNTVDAYDPKAGVMYGPRQMVSPRKNLSATTLLDGRVLLAGGNDGTQDLAILEIVDLSTSAISVVGSLSVARSGHVAMALPNNGDVLIAGGVSSGTPVSSAELFSPANSSVRSAGNMSVARSSAIVAGAKSSGHTLVAGGESSGKTSTGDLYAFPTVSTDKPDYAPNTTVKISGTGWTPGETVTLVLHEQPANDPDVTFTAVANNSGSIQNSAFKPDVHDEQINFILTAEGQTSGVFAQTVFADSTYSTQLSSPTPTSGGAGTVVNATATLQYGIPQYQTNYYYYQCNPYPCYCGWGGCSTCYNTCEGWYSVYIGTNYYPLPGQSVQFSFDNGSPVIRDTDVNGNVSVSLTVPVGATSLTATYAGSSDGTYGGSLASAGFTVTSLPLLTVAATNPTGTYGQPLPPLTYTMTGFLNGDTQGSATSGAPSEGTAASPTSTPGAYPIVITQGSLAAPNYGFAFANGTLALQQAPSIVTVTSLNSGIYPNQSTTLTATVSVTGSGVAPTQSVNFMLGAALLGTATLSPIDATDSTATLTIKGLQLAAGDNSISAVYSGDANYGGSTSTPITVTLLSPQVNFGSVPVGEESPVQALTYSFNYPTTLSAVNILTEGASGLDYKNVGDCAVGVAYLAGQSCTLVIKLKPSAPGLRSGGVALFVQNYNLMTWYLNGIGQSPAVTIDPGTQSTIATLGNSGQAYGEAIDGVGNVYVVDHANSQVIELAAGTFAQSTVVSSGLSNPTAAALDGVGNLYISDTGNSRVVMVPNEQGTLNSADMSTVSITGLGLPTGLATDGSGNLYIADATNGDVVEVPPVGGTQITVATGLTSPQGVAVDAAGNVYVAGNNQVTEYPMGGGTPVPMGSGYNNPLGVAVDASGTAYVLDSGNARIVRVAAGGAAQANLPASLSNPQGIALDATGNLYVTDGPSFVYEINRVQAAPLAFASTNVGSTSAPLTVTVSDAGNQPLAVSNLVVTTNFTQVPSGGTDCTASTQLSSGGQCLAAVALAPTISGPLAGTLTLSDNALNVTVPSTQAVQLSGNATQVLQTITFPTIAAQTYGAGSVTLSATASSGLAVSYAVTSGPASVSGNILTITGAGSVTVQASQAGNAEYTPASPVSQTFTVNQAATNIVWSNSAAITYGTALSATQLNATATPVSAGSFVYTPVVGTVLAVGSQTLSVTFTPSDSNYAPSTGSATLQVNSAVVTVTATNATGTYGQPVPSVAYTMAGFVNGDAQNSATTGSPTEGTSATPTSPAGQYPITISQGSLASANYTFSFVNGVLTIQQASQSISFTAIPNQTYGAGPLTLNATDSSGLAVSYAVISGPATVSGNMLTISGAGIVTVQANQAGNVNYTAAAPVSQSFAVGQASQTINFPAIPNQTFGCAPYVLNATASSGLAVSYAVTSGAATVSGSALIITGAGSVTVQASQPGNVNYTAAAPVSQSFTVNQASQSITVTQSAPSFAPYIGSFTVVAAASSGLPVTFGSTGACTNAGATFTMTNSKGTCTVTASQSGNANYLAAPSVLQTTTAAKAAPAVAFTGAPATAPYQSTFTVTATTNSGITPTIAATGSCSLSGTTVTMTSGTGTCTMTAKWAANTYYLAMTVAQTTTAEKLVSTVNWTGPAAITYGTALSGTELNATASVPGNFVYSPAAGAIPKAGSDTLKVTFTPTLSKDYTTATASAVIQVNPATPVITWPTPAAIAYGTALSATQLDATANTAGTFAYSPAAGTELTAGTYTLSVTFTPTDHTDYTKATASVTLVVDPSGTTTTITSNLPDPSTTGKAVPVHFTVTPATTHTAPTGSVTVNASTGESCTGTLTGGSGSCSVTFNSKGARSLTATYSGDSNNKTSVSTAVTQTVN